MTTGPQWGQSFSYDGFGNMLAQTVTKGQAPTLSVNVDPATNRITTGGYSYDSNGNLTAMPLLATSYNVDNRLAQAVSSLNGTDQFVYDPQGQRVWKSENGSWMVYFYGVDGNLLGVYGGPSYGDYNIYFGRKLIYTQSYPAGPVVEDRLASTVKHFPYGEEPSTTNQNRTKFATYYRDATTALDYAQQRYYARTIGRFTSPDPYQASGGPADPQSWNRFSYVQNDPVNFNDPSGLMMGWANFFALDGLGASSPGGGGYAPCLVDGIYTDCAWAQRMPNAVETGGLPTVAFTETGVGMLKADVAGNLGYSYLGVIPKEVRVDSGSDCYVRDPLGLFRVVYERRLDYWLYGTDNKPFPTGRRAVVTERLRQVKGPTPPESSPSKPGAPFQDEISVRGGEPFIVDQTFTAKVDGSPYPLRIVNRLGQTYGSNRNTVYPGYVDINGDRNLDSGGKPNICQ